MPGARCDEAELGHSSLFRARFLVLVSPTKELPQPRVHLVAVVSGTTHEDLELYSVLPSLWPKGRTSDTP